MQQNFPLVLLGYCLVIIQLSQYHMIIVTTSSYLSYRFIGILCIFKTSSRQDTHTERMMIKP